MAISLSLSLTALSVTALSHGPSTALSPSQTLPPLQTSLQNPKTKGSSVRQARRGRHRHHRKQIPPLLHQV
ncbi:hypothetical protein Syun_023029 [Stephania yunnanensis]|uniref:Uncharacterized protein n=1 Tax=Stephania yunnanensis TaxID=152371 RepID=A0AAP0FL91_9MAGN